MVLVGAVPMLVIYVLSPLWAAHSIASFDRDAVQLLSTGRASSLVARYQRALGMRLFAPPAASAERYAMALAEGGDMRAARAAYQDALDEYGGVAPLRVMLGYAHASFALGDDARAIPMYRKLLETTGSLPGVERHLAHALLRSGDDASEALALLDRVPREPDGAHKQSELFMLRAVAYARLGDRVRAAELEARAGAAIDDATRALRELLDAAQSGSALPRV